MTDKHDIDDDPMFDVSNEAMDRARNRSIDPYIARVMQHEEERRVAGEKIKAVWNEVEAAGLNVREARRKLVLRSIQSA